MALNFPSPATNGQTWTDPTGRQWVYDTGNNSWTAKGGAAGGMVYKGGIDITTAPPAGVQSGWLYAVTTGGTANAGFTGLTGTVPVGSQVVYGGPNWQLLSQPGPWSRTGTELSPAIAGDSVFTTGAVKVGGTTAAPNLQLKADGGIVANTDGLVYDAATKRLGIGTTTATSLFTCAGTGQFTGFANPSGGAGLELGYDGTNSIVQSFNRATSAHRDLLLSGNTIQWSIAGGEAARIDSSRRLLVGTSSALAGATDSLLQIRGNSQGTQFAGKVALAADVAAGSIVSGTDLGAIYFGNVANGIGGLIECKGDAQWGTNDYPGRLTFSTTASGASSPTERMRITSAGNLLFGTTTKNITSPNNPGFEIHVQNTGGLGIYSSTTNNNITGVVFQNPNGRVGFIDINANSVAYGTTSDYRLKENVVPLAGAINRINQLPVHRFNFTGSPNTTMDGFLAHEAQAVVPEAVTGEKDAVDDDGNPIYQGIDQSKLVPLLTAALQEALVKIETLEARLTAAGI